MSNRVFNSALIPAVMTQTAKSQEFNPFFSYLHSKEMYLMALLDIAFAKELQLRYLWIEFDSLFLENCLNHPTSIP